MYESFKNFELHRHQVSTRIDKSLKDYSDENRSNADNISSTIFSACFSIVTTFVSQENDLNGYLIFVLFIIAYIVAFFTYKVVSGKIRTIYYNTKRHGGSANSRKVKELIDNFDHIACDNNLIARVFLNEYKTEGELCLSTFEFYELFYYARVSAETTLSVLENADSCINTLSESSRVDLHRIYNQLNMLIIAKEFLLASCMDTKIDIHANLRPVLIDQINRLAGILTKIQEECDKFRELHFSDSKVQPLIDKYADIISPKVPTTPNP